MKNSYIVQITVPTTAFHFEIKPYLARVVSYKKGYDGILFTFSIDKAHKYKTEKNAQVPAQKFGGEISYIMKM